MKKVNIFLLCMLLLSIAAIAQNDQPPIATNWDAKPHMHAVPPEYMKEHAIILMENEVHEFKFEGKGITHYVNYHRLIKVLDIMGIEEFNTVEVPFRVNYSRVDSIKARTILPNGTVKNFEYKMLYGNMHEFFFALDGLEKDAEIEVMIKYKALTPLFGISEFQYSIPVVNSYFELNYPKEITFNTKGYHGCEPDTARIVGGHKQIKMYLHDIPGLEHQKYSFYDLYRLRLEYGVDHVTSRGGYLKGEKYGWDGLAADLYNEFYKERKADSNDKGGLYGFITMDHYNKKKKDSTFFSRFLTSLGIRGGESELQKIKLIEDGVKSNIGLFPELEGPHGDDLDTILYYKSASEKGMVKFFTACFSAMGIRHELGVTSNRSEHIMDQKFINWEPLTDYVFYFPNLDRYMAPNEPYYRCPEIPWEMINNKGVFCRTNPETEYTFGSEVAEGDAIIRTISAPDVNSTRNELKVNISFNTELDPSVELIYAYTGYSAAENRELLAKVAKEKRKDIVAEMIGMLDRKEDLLNFKFENEAFSNVYKQRPLILKAAIKAPQLIEQAAGKYVIRIGEAIGQQFHLYDKDERILPIDLQYPHNDTRVITMTLPEGAKLEHLAGLKTYSEHTEKDNANTTAWFSSDYKLVGNKLVVTITEGYKQLHYPVREYNDFKKVVNASADFDKATIIMELGKPHAKPVKKMKQKASATNAKPMAPKPANKA